MDFQDIATITSLSMGWEMNENDLLKIGEQIINLERVYSTKEGITKKDDVLPKKFMNEPLSMGPAKGQVVRLEPMLKEYYELMGWDQNGIPSSNSQ